MKKEATRSNNPPDMAVTAVDTAVAVNDYLKENPTIETEEQAKEAKVFIDRAKLCVQDLEAERRGLVEPLNLKVRNINEHYRGPRDSLIQVGDELNRRVSDFLREQEQRRLRDVERAREVTAEAERKARAAEQVEQERLDDARRGELGVDVLAATRDADEAFNDFRQADQKRRRLERETVKVTGGFTRALGLRAKEEIFVVDAAEAIREIGLTEAIIEAICKGARAFKKLHRRWPSGVKVETERRV